MTTTVHVKGDLDFDTFSKYLSWCVETLPDNSWSTHVATFNAANIKDCVWNDDIFTFDDAEDAVAFKLKFGI